jgi:hypothetical protein
MSVIVSSWRSIQLMHRRILILQILSRASIHMFAPIYRPLCPPPPPKQEAQQQKRKNGNGQADTDPIFAPVESPLGLGEGDVVGNVDEDIVAEIAPSQWRYMVWERRIASLFNFDELEATMSSRQDTIRLCNTLYTMLESVGGCSSAVLGSDSSSAIPLNGLGSQSHTVYSREVIPPSSRSSGAPIEA